MYEIDMSSTDLASYPDRIASKIKVSELDWFDGTPCWDWLGATSIGGYGYGRFNGHKYLHRFTLAFRGDLPDDMLVRHLCNRKICCNPDHLKAGSHSENQKDAYLRERKEYRTNRRTKRPSDIDGLPLIDWVRQNIVTIEDQCWIVYLSPAQSYPYLNIRGKTMTLHRYLHCITSGRDYNDDSWVARHTCHRKACVNPDHVLGGTWSENQIDSRHYSGVAKLSEDKVIKIVEDYVATSFTEFGSIDRFCRNWAQKYGLNKTTIHHILEGKAWSDLTGALLATKEHIWKPTAWNSRLNPNAVQSIRNDIVNWNFDIHGEKKKFARHWAEYYSVSVNTIELIRRGKIWTSLMEIS